LTIDQGISIYSRYIATDAIEYNRRIPTDCQEAIFFSRIIHREIQYEEAITTSRINEGISINPRSISGYAIENDRIVLAYCQEAIFFSCIIHREIQYEEAITTSGIDKGISIDSGIIQGFSIEYNRLVTAYRSETVFARTIIHR
jgi:hypothetical protein